MRRFLGVSRAIDALNEQVGRVASAAVLLSCLISAGNAMVRYAFDISSNAWLEIQWYLFTAVVMLGASHTFKLNEHVRVDIFYGRLTDRAQKWLDLLGALLFMVPACAIIGYMAWPIFLDAWSGNELSSNAGGLVRWPFKVLVPAGFALLCLQGLSEILKRAIALHGDVVLDTHYERPVQ